MRTSADDDLENARNHIKEAIAFLAKIVVEDEFNEDFSSKIRTAFLKLTECRDALKP